MIGIDEIIIKFHGKKYGRTQIYDNMKDIDYMKIAIREKFTQSEVCREVLLSTTEEIKCYSDYDDFWGRGCNAGRETSGHNHLGKLLTELREELQEELKV